MCIHRYLYVSREKQRLSSYPRLPPLSEIYHARNPCYYSSSFRHDSFEQDDILLFRFLLQRSAPAIRSSNPFQPCNTYFPKHLHILRTKQANYIIYDDNNDNNDNNDNYNDENKGVKSKSIFQ